MFGKTIVFALCVTVAFAGDTSGWKKFPAGVNPQLCPDYPHCDNAVLGAYAKAEGDVALAYSARAHDAPAYSAYGHGHPVPVAKGYPAWVHPKTCPNYPFCGATPVPVPNKIWTPKYWAGADAAPAYSAYGHGQSVPVAEGYPAAVNPKKCPNYPFCGPTPVHVPTKIWAPKYWAGAHAATSYSAYGHGHSVPVAEGYPAAVNPKKCPNYPFCGPTPAHVPTKVWKPSSGHAGHVSVVPVAKGYPAGLHPITCPNYPFCGPTPAHVPSKVWTSSNRYADAAPELVAWAPSTDASYDKGSIW